MAPKSSEILRSARDILAKAEALVKYLEKNNREEPSFSADSPLVPNNAEYDALRIPLSNTAEDLIRLVNGPTNWLRTFFCTHYDFAAWQVALEFKYFENVPLKGSISLADLSEKVGMDPVRLGTVMRLLATQRVFVEVEEGVFAHTATSALIAKDESINATISMQVEEMFKASAETSEAVKLAPFDSDTKITPFMMRHKLPAYQWYTENPEKGARFALAMAGVTKMDRQIEELPACYPWPSLKRKKIVDVGGGSGHVSMYLASHFPELEFVVQDVSENMLAQAEKNPAFKSLKGRVTFQQHNFFEPETIYTAGAFFMRQITHNYNDTDCVRIFKNLAVALEKSAPGTPLLINDTVLPKLHEKPAFEEHSIRQLDMCMFVGYGARQRTEKEFLKLLKQADERYEIKNVYNAGGMGLIEVHLEHYVRYLNFVKQGPTSGPYS